MSSYEPGGEPEDLLARMAAIAEAVNAFDSPEVQLEAFRFLTSQAGSMPAAPPPGKTGRVRKKVARKRSAPEATTRSEEARRRTGQKKLAFELVKSLDLHSGTEPFKDFADRKSPARNVDKCVVAVYWLQHIAETAPITIDHVYTCFKGSRLASAR